MGNKTDNTIRLEWPRQAAGNPPEEVRLRDLQEPRAADPTDVPPVTPLQQTRAPVAPGPQDPDAWLREQLGGKEDPDQWLVTAYRRLQTRRALMAVWQASFFDTGLWKKLQESVEAERSLYGDEDPSRGPALSKESLLAQVRDRTWPEMVLAEHRDLYDALSPWKAEATPKHTPGVRATNVLYLSQLADLDMEQAEVVYDDLVRHLWGGRQPKDIRPLTRWIRRAYTDHWMRRNGINPVLFRAATRLATGDGSVDWNHVLENIPDEAKPEFLNYVMMVTPPKDRSFGRKLVDQFMRGVWRSAANVRDFAVADEPLLSPEVRQRYETLRSEWEAEHDKSLPDVDLLWSVMGSWHPLVDSSVIREQAGITEEQENAAYALYQQAIHQVADARAFQRETVEATWQADPIEGEGLLQRAAIGTAGLLPNVAGSAAAGIGTAGVGTAAYWYVQVAPDMYFNLRELGFDDETARGVSSVAAIPVALINTLQVRQLAKLGPAARETAGRAAERGILRYLGSKAADAVKTYGEEMAEETLEAVVDGMAVAVADALSETNPEIDWLNDVIKPEIEGLKEAALAMPLLVAGGKGVEITSEARMINEVRQATGMTAPQARGVIEAMRQNKPFVFIPNRVWASMSRADKDAVLKAFGSSDAKEQSRILREVSERYLAENYAKAEQTVKAILEANGVEGVTVEGAELGKQGDELVMGVTGLNEKGRLVVRLAFSGYDPQTRTFMTTIPEGVAGPDTQTGAHEAFHVLEAVLDPDELAVIDAHFKGDREAAARAFGRFVAEYRGEVQADALAKAWAKAADLLAKVKAAFVVRQFRSYADVFRAMVEGRVKKGRADTAKPSRQGGPQYGRIPGKPIRFGSQAATEIQGVAEPRQAEPVPEVERAAATEAATEAEPVGPEPGPESEQATEAGPQAAFETQAAVMEAPLAQAEQQGEPERPADAGMEAPPPAEQPVAAAVAEPQAVLGAEPQQEPQAEGEPEPQPESEPLPIKDEPLSEGKRRYLLGRVSREIREHPLYQQYVLTAAENLEEIYDIAGGSVDWNRGEVRDRVDGLPPHKKALLRRRMPQIRKGFSIADWDTVADWLLERFGIEIRGEDEMVEWVLDLSEKLKKDRSGIYVNLLGEAVKHDPYFTWLVEQRENLQWKGEGTSTTNPYALKEKAETYRAAAEKVTDPKEAEVLRRTANRLEREAFRGYPELEQDLVVADDVDFTEADTWIEPEDAPLPETPDDGIPFERRRQALWEAFGDKAKEAVRAAETAEDILKASMREGQKLGAEPWQTVDLATRAMRSKGVPYTVYADADGRAHIETESGIRPISGGPGRPQGLRPVQAFDGQSAVALEYEAVGGVWPVRPAAFETRPAEFFASREDFQKAVAYAMLDAARARVQARSDLRRIRQAQVRPLKRSVRVRVREVTGKTKIGDLYYEEEALRQALRKAARAARSAYAAGRRDQAEKERQRRRALTKKRKAVREAKARMRKAVQALTAPIPGNVHWSYREAISALTAGIDLHRRAEKTLHARQRTAEYLKRHPEKIAEVPRKVLEAIQSKPLNDYSLEQLEALAAERQRLIKLGRLKYDLWIKHRKRVDERLRHAAIDAITEGRGVQVRQGVVVGPAAETLADRAKKTKAKIDAATLRPVRLFDMLEHGHGTFDGPITRMLYDQVKQAKAKKLRWVDRRTAELVVAMESLGITWRQLTAPVHLPDVLTAQGQWTLQRMIGVYVYHQNARADAALRFGNRLSESQIRAIIDRLTPSQKALGDWIIAACERRKGPLFRAVAETTNVVPEEEENYAPMRRVNAEFGTPEEQLITEIEHRAALKKGYADRGFSYARKDIPAEFQSPIDLDVVKIFIQQVDVQEHFIALAPVVNRLHRVFQSPEVRTAIKQQFADAFNKAVRDYINRVANPNIYKTYGDLDNLSRWLRRNVATAYLSFNVLTWAKQLPSLALYLRDAGVGHLLASALEFARGPRALMETVAKKDPTIKHRLIEREIEEMYAATEGSGRWLDRVRRAGMAPIRLMDSVAVTIGWNAVYQANLEEHGEAEAVRRARNATMRTQPAAAPEDLPGLYTTSEWLNWSLMFTNQLNQLYNIARYDLPRDVARGGWPEAARSVAGMVIAALLIQAIGGDEPPEELEGMPGYIAWAALVQQVNAIPLIGSAAMAYRKGWRRDNPILRAPAETIAALLRMDWMRAAKSGVHTLALLEGLPLVAAERTYRAVAEGEPGELIGRRGKK